MVEFKDVSQYEYLVRISTPNAESGLFGSRPYRLESTEEKNGEALHSHIDKACAVSYASICSRIRDPSLPPVC
ncbi:unnamed protein product [Dibothriocephalus latus]|uniref:Uncharacterized protein n=1 Tax=Dibothriocephalus latus TaxID=60516 RepID=A0A3P7LNM2_DIBLA|nr:unnamed protein product [Dibothriocephalus latus]